MKLKLIKVGTSGAIVIPKDIRRVFDYKIYDVFKTEFSKNKIVLTKLKIAQPVQKPKVPAPVLEPILEDEPESIAENKLQENLLIEVLKKRAEFGRNGYAKYLHERKARGEPVIPEIISLYYVWDDGFFHCNYCDKIIYFDLDTNLGLQSILDFLKHLSEEHSLVLGMK